MLTADTRRRQRAVLATAAAILVLLMGRAVPSMGDPVSEYLSDVFYDRVLFFSQGWGELGMDTCAHAPGIKPLTLRIGSQEYAKGLGHHAPGEMLVDLNGEFEAFEADIGVQWQQGTTGTVVFQVFVDGEKQLDSGIMRERDPARHIRVTTKGAGDLRLVVTDAGDGITCDCADWANARLIRDPSPPRRPERQPFDAAPFARVVTSDPDRMDGCRANRVQEFPAEDVYPETDLAPDADGTYAVPKARNEKGCIGLLWAERRFPRELAIEFADAGLAPDPDGVSAQYWTGESRWQGQWKPVSAAPEVDGALWTWHLKWGEDTDTARRGVQKVRWVFDPAQQPIAVRRPWAFTHSRWATVDLSVQLDKSIAGEQGQVEAYNGEFVGSDAPDASRRRAWDLGGPLRLKVRYTTPQSLKADRTVLRFVVPGGGFAVAVEDVLERGCVYLPDFGAYVMREPAQGSPAEYREQIRGRKTVLERVREMPDQTFAQAIEKVHRPMQDNGPVMLSLACDNGKFVVDRDGTFGPYREGHTHPSYVFHIVPRFGSGASTLGSRHLEGGWLPVPAIRAEENGVGYSERTFVAPQGGGEAGGSSPWWNPRPLCVAEFGIENAQPRAADVSLRLDFAVDDAAQLPGAELRADESGVMLRDGQRLLAFVDTGALGPLEARIEGRSLVLSGRLTANATARCRVCVPGWDAKVEEAGELASGAPGVEDVEAYWSHVLESGMKVRIPDELLENVIRASQVYCLMAARNEEQCARIAPWIASDRYGPLESEGHSIVLGMDLFGHHDFAQRCLDFHIKRYNEAGFLTTGYTLMGTGWHLWTLGEHYALTGDSAWMRANAEEVARVCQWVAAQRKKTERLQPNGERPPEWGLVPPGVAADWNVYAYRFFVEAHYCAGLRDAAQALQDVGYPGAGALLQDAAGFREDLLRAYRWAQERTPARALANGTFAPGIPPMLYCFGPAGDFFPGEDGNRSWAGDVEIGTHYLVALGVMDPARRDVGWMADALEDYWCLHDGMGEYPGEASRADWFNLGGFSKVQPYYTRMIDLHALRDDVKPFIRSYFNAIPSLLNLENLSMWEHFHNGGAWNKTHETGWLLQQTRTMLVMERGNELWLAPFVTNNWLKDGMTVSVRDAPTRFGPVSYEIRSSADSGIIEARIEPPTRSAPDAIVIRLRHPQGKRVRSVTVNGKRHTDFDAERECVRLKATGERVVVRARY